MTAVEARKISRPSREPVPGGAPASAPPGRGAEPAGRPTEALLVVGLVAAVLVGVAIRCWLVLSRDFPLNDGGLFYAMADDLRRNGYALPTTTTYNGAALPFAYSPLALYAAATLAGLGVSLAEALRFLPLLATCLVLGAFVLLARELLPSRAAVVAATFAFAVVPRSSTWLLMGGGLTRSFGFLFALLTLWQVARLYKYGGWRHLLAATVLSALTILSHLGTAPFLVIGIVLLFFTYGRTWSAARASAILALGTALLSAPWWGTILAQHGLDTFRAANATGESLFSGYEARHRVLLSLADFGADKTGEPMAPIVWLFALIGGIAAVARGWWLLPAWWVLLLMFDGRQGGTFATVPVAMLAGVGLTSVLFPALTTAIAGQIGRRRAWISAALLLLGLLVYAGSWALTREQEYGGEGWTLEALTPAQRAAMAWIRHATPPGSRVLVVSGTWWPMDRTSEWLPVLADRPSVATVQGYEWVPGGVFARRVREYEWAQTCGGLGERCLEQWFARNRATSDYLFIPRIQPKPCCKRLLDELAVSPRWTRVFANPGAIIYERREPSRASSGPSPAPT
jgi:hypothetical protein